MCRRKLFKNSVLLLFYDQRLHIKLGEVLIEYAYTPSYKNCGADSAETHGMKGAGAAQVNDDACGDPYNVAAGFYTGKRELIHGADCSHESVRRGKHQIGSHNEDHAQSGDDNTGNEQHYAKPKCTDREFDEEHAQVDKIAEGDGQGEGKYYLHSWTAVDYYLANDAEHMKGYGHIAKSEGGDRADGVRYGADGGDAHVQAFDKNKADSHQYKAQNILGYSAFEIHNSTDSFILMESYYYIFTKKTRKLLLFSLVFYSRGFSAP